MKRLLSIMLLLMAVTAMSAQTTLSGVVTDSKTKEPLSHVSVMAEGTDVHTVTNEDGRFSLKVSERPGYIRLSHIGYKTMRHEMDGRSEGLQLVMTPHVVNLQEVIVSITLGTHVARAEALVSPLNTSGNRPYIVFAIPLTCLKP